MKKSLQSRNIEAAQRLANIDALRKWGNTPHQNTMSISEQVKYKENLGKEFLKSKVKYI